jgi:hypothetical protein
VDLRPDAPPDQRIKPLLRLRPGFQVEGAAIPRGIEPLPSSFANNPVDASGTVAETQFRHATQ